MIKLARRHALVFSFAPMRVRPDLASAQSVEGNATQLPDEAVQERVPAPLASYGLSTRAMAETGAWSWLIMAI